MVWTSGNFTRARERSPIRPGWDATAGVESECVAAVEEFGRWLRYRQKGSGSERALPDDLWRRRMVSMRGLICGMTGVEMDRRKRKGCSSGALQVMG